jgi:prolyl oligopeptidase PreP (S9A serine peptidase family)
MKRILLAIVITTLSSCSSINSLYAPLTLDHCLHPSLPVTKDSECELMPWVDYWLQVNTLSWKDRQQLLANITNNAAINSTDKVKIVLLSHVPNTPYQTRLRAQSIAQKLTQSNQGKLASFIHYIVFLHSQEKLELESALATKTQLALDQLEQINKQSEKISEQELQINKLLQIEKNIVEKPNESTL